jgi:hypothetical protein
MPHQKSTSNSIQNVKYTSINKDNEPGEKVKTFSSARLSEKSKDFLDNEPSSFESEDSKSRMLLNNLPKGKIVNEPYQATLDKLPCTAKQCNEPGEIVKTFSSARLSEKSKDFSDNKRRKPYIITKKIVYESCAIGCKWYMIYK